MSTSVDPPVDPAGTCRHDGWTNDRRRLFLVALSNGHSVESACAHVGMSRASAYKCRGRDPAFARAWSAACLWARPVFPMPKPSIDGHVRIITRSDGSVVRHHSFDNRSDMVRLARLDRRVMRDHAPAGLAPRGRSVRDSATEDFDWFADFGSDGAGEA